MQQQAIENNHREVFEIYLEAVLQRPLFVALSAKGACGSAPAVIRELRASGALRRERARRMRRRSRWAA